MKKTSNKIINVDCNLLKCSNFSNFNDKSNKLFKIDFLFLFDENTLDIMNIMKYYEQTDLQIQLMIVFY